MAFDATDAPAEVQVRERLMRLRNFLADLPTKKFCMDYRSDEADVDSCDTVCCAGGWGAILFRESLNGCHNSKSVGHHIGLSEPQAFNLFWPFGQDLENADGDWGDVTPTQFVRVLDHLIAIGEVDWSVRGEP